MQDKKRKLHAKKTGYAGMLLAALLVLGGCTKKEEILFLGEETAVAEPEADEVAQTESTEETVPPVQTEPDRICIHVCGAVQMPGVYELQAGSRVYEAVQAAGGFAAEADQNYVNQAQELTDGVKLVIPTVEEAVKSAGSQAAIAQIGIAADTLPAGTQDSGQSGESDGKININTASEAQLCEIPGIGATRAAAIAAYRESQGAFQKPEDIMKVNGIKEGMYEKIKDSISVN